MDISTSIFGMSASSNENEKSKDDCGEETRIPDAIEFLNQNLNQNPDADSGGGDLLNALAIICDDNHASRMNHMQGIDTAAISQDASSHQMALLSNDMPLLASANNKRHHPGQAYYHPRDHSDSPATTSHEDSGKRRRKSRCTHPRLTWEERIQQLQDYKDEHGDLLIPIRFKENPSLGKFVHNTREQYKLFLRNQKQEQGGSKPTKRCSLTPERIAQLEALGFAWSTDRTKHQKEDWEARLQQLKDYKAKHGDCLVPHGYAEDPSFAEWVHRQRTTHAHMLKEQADHSPHHSHHPPNPLVGERMIQLEELGFHFTVHADKWMEHWKELKAYKAMHGDCLVPTHCPENPKLGRWVHTQRHQRRLQLKGKKSCMTDERVQLLDSLGFSWDVRHLNHHHHHHDPTDFVAPNFVPFEPQQQAYLDQSNIQGHHQQHQQSTMAVHGMPPPDQECLLQMQQGNNPNASNADIFGHGMAMV
ncbi:helicase [Seminavis robusta]|uniref:Helicase n=1 Tax=Seminavis robusta TaxID=568900 RepID=A0A9N8EHK0_9STRA|nr:helicase [Seminavis robusta]|eukprot:Sro1007_g230370.1 helicase (475) ;mRNA; r:10239-11899